MLIILFHFDSFFSIFVYTDEHLNPDTILARGLQGTEASFTTNSEGSFSGTQSGRVWCPVYNVQGCKPW